MLLSMLLWKILFSNIAIYLKPTTTVVKREISTQKSANFLGRLTITGIAQQTQQWNIAVNACAFISLSILL